MKCKFSGRILTLREGNQVEIYEGEKNTRRGGGELC